MFSWKYPIARLCALLFAGLSCGQAATLRDSQIASPVAFATNANVEYCFARVRGLDPERLPPAYLVVRAHVMVAYSNAGTRPIILPLERARTIYTALKPGPMNVFKDNLGLFDLTFKIMKDLPGNVSPESPLIPKNHIFNVIPAGGEMTPPLSEEVILPVNRQGVFRKYPDLRGHRVYVKLRFVHRQLSAALQADLSDRWSRFGVPWSGTLTTNTILIDVPSDPKAAPCVDSYDPAHPVEGLIDLK